MTDDTTPMPGLDLGDDFFDLEDEAEQASPTPASSADVEYPAKSRSKKGGDARTLEAQKAILAEIMTMNPQDMAARAKIVAAESEAIRLKKAELNKSKTKKLGAKIPDFYQTQYTPVASTIRDNASTETLLTENAIPSALTGLEWHSLSGTKKRNSMMATLKTIGVNPTSESLAIREIMLLMAFVPEWKAIQEDDLRQGRPPLGRIAITQTGIQSLQSLQADCDNAGISISNGIKVQRKIGYSGDRIDATIFCVGSSDTHSFLAFKSRNLKAANPAGATPPAGTIPDEKVIILAIEGGRNEFITQVRSNMSGKAPETLDEAAEISKAFAKFSLKGNALSEFIEKTTAEKTWRGENSNEASTKAKLIAPSLGKPATSHLRLFKPFSIAPEGDTENATKKPSARKVSSGPLVHKSLLSKNEFSIKSKISQDGKTISYALSNNTAELSYSMALDKSSPLFVESLPTAYTLAINNHAQPPTQIMPTVGNSTDNLADHLSFISATISFMKGLRSIEQLLPDISKAKSARRESEAMKAAREKSEMQGILEVIRYAESISLITPAPLPAEDRQPDNDRQPKFSSKFLFEKELPWSLETLRQIKDELIQEIQTSSHEVAMAHAIQDKVTNSIIAPRRHGFSP